MIISRRHGLGLIKRGAISRGLTCSGARWPEGDIYIILDRPDILRTDHYLATNKDINTEQGINLEERTISCN